MDKALLIIDYSYDFIADDGKLTCGKPGQSIAQAIARKFEAYIAEGQPVFITMDLHDFNDMSHPGIQALSASQSPRNSWP